MSDRHSTSGGDTASATAVGSGSSVIDFHRGEALLSFCRQYPSLMKTILEMIQNGIDMEATVVYVAVDLDARQVFVIDDGLGTTQDDFHEALLSVAKSVKKPGKLGKFGIGLVSPIDKCECMEFSSIARRGAKHGYTWTFRQDDIRQQHHELEIPHRRIKSLPAVGKSFKSDLTGRFGTKYQTMVKLTKVTSDRLISQIDLDTLSSEVYQNFGAAMQRNGVEVRIAVMRDGVKEVRDIDPEPFRGDPFDVVVYEDSDTGRVEIELFRAPRQRGRRQGDVSFMMLGDDFGVTMKSFANQARGGSYWDVVANAIGVLGSGFFEGVIRCEGIELNADRASFKYNEALHNLYLVLDTWYEEHGRELYDAERQESDRDRYENLGTQSLERLQELLPDGLWRKFGRPSPDPKGDEKAKDTGDGETGDAPGTRGGSGSGGGGVPGGRTGETRRPTKRRPGPGDTGGKEPTMVRGSSQGLSFSYDELVGNSRLWEFDFSTGTLILNIRHPVWVRLDETGGKHTSRNDRWIMHLQEWLAFSLLNLLVSHPSSDELEANREQIDRQIVPYVGMFITSRR